jgi:hypothetical protein
MALIQVRALRPARSTKKTLGIRSLSWTSLTLTGVPQSSQRNKEELARNRNDNGTPNFVVSGASQKETGQAMYRPC